MALSAVSNFFQNINDKITHKLNTPTMQENTAKLKEVYARVSNFIKNPRINIITKLGVAALILLGLYLAYTYILFIAKATLIVGGCFGIYKLFQKYLQRNPQNNPSSVRI